MAARKSSGTAHAKATQAARAVDATGQLASFFAEYDPVIAALGQRAVARMREYLPGAFRLVYNNYNALVIGFGPTERTPDVVFSIALYPRWVNLFFARGAQLPDPGNVLNGGGKFVRSFRLSEVSDLDRPEIRTLIKAGLTQADWEPTDSSHGSLIIKAIASKRQPRKPRPAPASR